MAINCKIIRSGILESLHQVYAVVVGPGGEIIYNNGNADYLTCVRSSLKPFQAAASVQTGAVEAAGFSEAELALMCASHSGEEIHADRARSMLNKLGYAENLYECGSHLPFELESKYDQIRKGGEISPVYNNCSGKHAGMLCLSKHLQVPPQGYTGENHPVQKKIISLVKEMAEVESISLGVDGCNAPAPFLPLRSIALLFQKLASRQLTYLDQIYTAMVNNPYLIAGKGRFDTDFMIEMHGQAVCKGGAEGVKGLGLRLKDGSVWGFALKVLDGNQRAADPAAMAVLKHLKLLNEQEQEALMKYINPQLLNHRQIKVGEIITELEP